MKHFACFFFFMQYFPLLDFINATSIFVTAAHLIGRGEGRQKRKEENTWVLSNFWLHSSFFSPLQLLTSMCLFPKGKRGKEDAGGGAWGWKAMNSRAAFTLLRSDLTIRVLVALRSQSHPQLLCGWGDCCHSCYFSKCEENMLDWYSENCGNC